MRFSSLAIVAVPSLFLACSASTGPDENLGTNASPEVWSDWDDAEIFGTPLERDLAALPMSGEAAVTPWTGNYWPTYEDNINHRWAGPTTDSPAKKYEKAFNGTGVEDAVSLYHGIDSQTGSKVCTETSECDTAKSEVCAKRSGKKSGRCTETWFGICHAWAPAAILVPEPKNPVVKNGVTFNVQDLKALVTLVHNQTTSKFVSLRCNKDDDSGKITYDAAGRAVDADRECRDTNPGTYHLLLANYLGVKKQSFVEDRTMDYQVWNQPIRRYRVRSKEVVTAQAANALLGVTTVGGTTVKKTGTVAKGEWSHEGSFPVTAGSTYRVVMNGSGDADVYVKFGAQPTDALYDCHDLTDHTSAEVCTGTVPAGATELFVSVNGYAAWSNFSIDITTGGSTPTAYAFNARAASLVRVLSEVQYLTESPSSTDGNLSSRVDDFTRTDRYDYILELDATGKIIGGEWLNDSRRNHPDFVWLPTGVRGASVANGKITYAAVKALLDESVAGTTVPTNETTVNENGTVANAEFKQFGPFKVASGTTLSATMTGSGDADLYVKNGSAPTAMSYDCRPYADDSSESCSSTGPGDVYVGVQGYAVTSDFQLTVKYTPAL